MLHIFEIINKSGKKIRLTETQWKHIKHKHPDVTELYIKETLQNSINILVEEDNVVIYYCYFKNKKTIALFEGYGKILKWRRLCYYSLFC